MSAQQIVYVAPEPSLLFQHVFNPFYTWVASFYPRSWSPNGITLFGIACTTFASLLFFSSVVSPTVSDPTTHMPLATSAGGMDRIMDFRLSPATLYTGRSAFATGDVVDASCVKGADAPAVQQALFYETRTDALGSFIDFSDLVEGRGAAFRAVMLTVGILNWIYAIADNTDGKQARATGRSSYVGEYLDHGLDCVTSLMSTFMLCACASERFGIAALAIVLVSSVTHLSHTTHYRTGILIWGNRFVSVDEAMVMFGALPIAVALFPGVFFATVRDALSALLSADVLSQIPEPALGLRIVQLTFLGFLLAQFVLSLQFLKRDVTLINAPFVALVLSLGALVGFGAYHEGGLSSLVQQQSAHLWNHELVQAATADGAPAPLRAVVLFVVRILTNYPSLWALAAAFNASNIIHIPIIAKCLHRKREVLTPIAAVIVSTLAFGASPIAGALLAVVSHVVQILTNIAELQSPTHTSKVDAAKAAKAKKTA